MPSKPVKAINLIVKDFLLTSFLLFCFVLVSLKESKYSAITLNGIRFWATSIVPTLFPFFVLTTVLTSLPEIKRLSVKIKPRNSKGVNGIIVYAFLISIICGYPTGSKTVASLYEDNLLSEKEAAICSGLCSTSTPFFIIITVGRLINDYISALFVFFAHIISVFITAIIINFSFKNYFKESDDKKVLSPKNSKETI